GSRTVPFCMLVELTGDNRPELMCRIVGDNRTAQIFDLTTQPPRELDWLPATAFEDVAAADFDNDGQFDLFLARKGAPGPIAVGRATDREFVADVSIDKGNVDTPMGFSFHTLGSLSLSVASGNPNDDVTTKHIYLGQQGAHPAGMKFELTPTTPGIGGLLPNAPAKDKGVYVGFTAPDKWDIRITASAKALTAGMPKNQRIQVRVAAATPITRFKVIGEANDQSAPARLFMNRGGKLVEESDKRGVNKRQVAGANVVVGDFDNDMDVDVFVLASADVGQQENLLLLNDGKGNFAVVKAAGGAAGSLSGVGDSVTTVDFDGDGFLDLLIANGGSMGRSLGLPSDGGGYQLFRNVGNGNHWIMIDLEGTRSNRDGIGAVVRVTAGGVTQMRVQDGGVHHRSQNHSRLHFGLAKNTKIDKITVHWPSGLVQELQGVKVNQVLRVKESGA
ncbi:MAG: CRTAC1 family protein, partial [Thiobacillus sp.]|nr:CRTAC1 family protein [Thiobacillus sp.]